MAVSGDLRVFATMGSYPLYHTFSGNSLSPSPSKLALKWPCKDHPESNRLKCNYQQSFGVSGDSELSPEPATQETQNLILNALNMSFLERLGLAWKILFPTPAAVRKSNANIAKQRLKMILFSDRCAVSDEAKQKIVSNIVGALSDFVEIDSQDKVELSVSTGTDLGTVYSVTVPVRRVKPVYQDYAAADEYGTITNIEYKDKGDDPSSVDVRFDFFVPDENSRL